MFWMVEYAGTMSSARPPTPHAAVRGEFVQLWGRLGPFWGVTPTAAKVYAELIASTEPRSGEELAAALELSRGGVSMATRELTDWGLVRVTRPAGSRRLAYTIEAEPERVIRAIVATRKRREWDPMLEHLRTWRAELARERSREAQSLHTRLGEIEALVSWVGELAEGFLRGGLVPRLGLKALAQVARQRMKKGSR
jgi:DNA-binding transcriptional regulator GbsR (MarR family)